MTNNDQTSVSENPSESASSAVPEVRAEQAGSETIICPVCGEITVQGKCNWVTAGGSPAVCHSEICRARVILNCSEF